MKLVSQTPKDRERQKAAWKAQRKFRELLAPYDLSAIPNPEVTKKKVSERV